MAKKRRWRVVNAHPGGEPRLNTDWVMRNEEEFRSFIKATTSGRLVLVDTPNLVARHWGDGPGSALQIFFVEET